MIVAASFVGIVALVPQVAKAQRVATYDFTDVKPLERLRPPLPQPKPKPGEMVGGACGGILQNPPLIVSLVSLDRDSYTFGDDFTFVLKLEASRATAVPVRASLAEVEPVDASKSYEWRPLGISLELRSLKYRTTGVGLLSLYGSKERPESEIALKPGEWVELIGKAKMEWSNLPHGTLPPNEEKYVLPLPLRQPEEFMGAVWAIRAEGYRFDAATQRETRVCHNDEASSSPSRVHVTVMPKSPDHRLPSPD